MADHICSHPSPLLLSRSLSHSESLSSSWILKSKTDPSSSLMAASNCFEIPCHRLLLRSLRIWYAVPILAETQPHSMSRIVISDRLSTLSFKIPFMNCIKLPNLCFPLQWKELGIAYHIHKWWSKPRSICALCFGVAKTLPEVFLTCGLQFFPLFSFFGQVVGHSKHSIQIYYYVIG